MKILIEVTHPAHVHFFRHSITEFQRRGHTVAVTARDKDVTTGLLDNYGIAFTTLSKMGRAKISFLGEWLARDARLLRFCRYFEPDILTAISGVFAAHVGWLLRKPVVVWDDTEAATAAHKITYPFVTAVYSPDCFPRYLGKKHHFYPGLHELAYLCPTRFSANAALVRDVGIDPKEKYCIIRFVSWQAHHDIGQYGFANEEKLYFVKEIAKYARPYVTSEGELPKELEPYRLSISPHLMHHVMAFAALYVGEGATMATESAILGVPSIYVSTLKLANMNMLKAYGLLRQTTDSHEALRYGKDLLSDEQVRGKCVVAREKLLREKIDVTDLIVKVIEQAVQGHGRKSASHTPDNLVEPCRLNGSGE